METINNFFHNAGLVEGMVAIVFVVVAVALIGFVVAFLAVRYISKKETIDPISTKDTFTPDPTMDIYNDDLELRPTWITWIIVVVLFSALVWVVIHGV